MESITPGISVSIILLLFGIGILLTRKDVVRSIMGIFLIYNGACLNFVTFSAYVDPTGQGQLAAMFIFVIGVVELIAVLALSRRYHRNFQKSGSDILQISQE